MVWDFSQDDNRNGSVGGIYGYIYPNSPASSHSPSHTASLQRISTGATTGAAQLKFNLDGPKYPSAGFGLMFSEAQSVDLRELRGIRVRLTSSQVRWVRISLSSDSSSLPSYFRASDTGASWGIALKVGPNGLDTLVPLGRFSWPTWFTGTPPVTDSQILANTTAIQFNVSCEDVHGICARDTGTVVLDSLRLVGVGGEWPDPVEGTCQGDPLTFSRFDSKTPTRNNYAGYWYTYSDATADSLARGQSRIFASSDTFDLSEWKPDSRANQADIRFHLVHGAMYSGFAALESQMGPSLDSLHSHPYDRPGLTAISFDLAFDSSFPANVAGVIFHAKKQGTEFGNGQDHQVRLPWQPGKRHWCLDFSSLKQPVWSGWKKPFDTDSLLALTWEVHLQGAAREAVGEFRLSDVLLWTTNSSVRSRPKGSGWSVHRAKDAIEVRQSSGAPIAEAVVVGIDGRILARRVLGSAGAESFEIPLRTRSAAWVRLSGKDGLSRTFAISPLD